MEYEERDIEELGEHYTKHLVAMTMEDLHCKTAIAAELAFRDKQIEELTAKKMPDVKDVEVKFDGMTMGDPFIPNDLFDHEGRMRDLKELLEHKHTQDTRSRHDHRGIPQGTFAMPNMGPSAEQAAEAMRAFGRTMRGDQAENNARGMKLVILNALGEEMAKFDCDSLERFSTKMAYHVDATGILEHPHSPSIIKLVDNGRVIGRTDNLSDHVREQFRHARRGDTVHIRAEIAEVPPEQYRSTFDFRDFAYGDLRMPDFPEVRIPKKTGRSAMTKGPEKKSGGKNKNKMRYG